MAQTHGRGAYARPQPLNRKGASFRDVVDRLTGKAFALPELVGILDENTARKLRAAKRDFGRRLRKGEGTNGGGVRGDRRPRHGLLNRPHARR